MLSSKEVIIFMKNVASPGSRSGSSVALFHSELMQTLDQLKSQPSLKDLFVHLIHFIQSKSVSLSFLTSHPFYRSPSSKPSQLATHFFSASSLTRSKAYLTTTFSTSSCGFVTSWASWYLHAFTTHSTNTTIPRLSCFLKKRQLAWSRFWWRAALAAKTWNSSAQTFSYNKYASKM